jgi:hypothetical protein
MNQKILQGLVSLKLNSKLKKVFEKIDNITRLLYNTDDCGGIFCRK